MQSYSVWRCYAPTYRHRTNMWESGVMIVAAKKRIRAAPEIVYQHVQALDRMPDRSPEAKKFEWWCVGPRNRRKTKRFNTWKTYA